MKKIVLNVWYDILISRASDALLTPTLCMITAPTEEYMLLLLPYYVRVKNIGLGLSRW